jgi:FG-GAP-like repeat/Calx-beta domain/FG-GAP repeat/HYR domain
MNAILAVTNRSLPRRRITFFLAALTLLLLAAPARAAFNAAVSYATGVQPIGIATADFNGDGKLDLVTANSNNNGNGTVSVLLGNGNGTFGAHNDLDASPGAASSLAVGDLDGDGKPDIVVGKNGSTVQVFINTGGGTFAPAVSYATGSQPYSIGLADVNGDGLLDIVTANLSSGNMSVLINQGAGTFITSAPIPVGNAPNGLVLEDFNADGRVDVVIVRQSPATLTVFLGNGDGTFAAALNQALTGSPRAVRAGDFNVDGKMDLAVANDTSPGEVDVLVGNGDGTFAAPVSYPTGAFPRSLAVAEFNGDTKVDLTVASTSTASADVLSGTGTGTFGAASPNSAGASANPNGIVVGDFNGDGKPDIATSNYGLNTISVMLNNSAAFSPAITVDDIRVTEGDSGTINATFSIRLSHASASTVTVNAITANGAAVTGADYTGLASTPVTFSPGVTSQVVNVLVKGDTTDEPPETFLLKLSGATNGYILDPIGVCTILDNDGPPAISISNAKVVEEDGGVTSATFTISLSVPSGNTVSVQYASADGTGANPATVADGDYFQATGSVTFPPGSISQTVMVVVQGDTKVEPNENFRLILSNPVNATIANPTGVGTIINDDGPNVFATNHGIINESCGAGSGAVDVGEMVTLSIILRNFSPAPTTNLTATLLNTGGVTNASAAQSYGTLSPASPSAAQNFTFTVDPTFSPGDVLTLTFALQDNGTALPPATVTIVLSQREPLRENFDSVAATGLPSGWIGHISVGVAGDSAWRTFALPSESIPNLAFGPSQAHVTDNALTSPAFQITNSSAKLVFRNNYNFEDGFDGAVLEISLDGGAFTDILTAGGSFVSGGYNKALSNVFGNPLGGRSAWTGNSGGFITTTVNLPASAAGKSVQLRWRLGTDTSTTQAGQFLDDIVVVDGTSAVTCACSVQCPANIVVPNDPGQCGAVVNFASGSINGGCGPVMTTPSSGSFFPVGVTTVTTTAPAGGATCTFTVTVQDTQKVCGVGTAVNVSTRLPVGAGDDALIEGFIVQGPAGSTKKIIVRAIGPSLLPFGIADALANPILEIHDSSSATVATNNDWKSTQIGGLISSDQFAEINSSGVAPSNDLESAIVANLTPGSYTAVVRGVGNTTGTGVVDAYDLGSASPARLGNIATRGLIQPGDKLMIAGFIVQNGPAKVAILGIGPSLTAFGINNALPDTTLQLRDQNGAIVRENDDWMTDQKAELEATGLQPSNDLEAALIQTIPPGQYTAQVRGKPETTGTGVVQVYFLP